MVSKLFKRLSLPYELLEGLQYLLWVGPSTDNNLISIGVHVTLRFRQGYPAISACFQFEGEGHFFWPHPVKFVAEVFRCEHCVGVTWIEIGEENVRLQFITEKYQTLSKANGW